LPPGPRAIGSPGSHPLTRFRAQPWHFLTAVPAANSSRSSSHAALPLQSSCAPTPAPSSQSGQHLPRVFCPLRDVTGSVLAGEDSAPHCGPPSGFLNLSAVCSAASFAGLFRPAATSRVRSAQRGGSLRRHGRESDSPSDSASAPDRQGFKPSPTACPTPRWEGAAGQCGRHPRA
jgi:hypothetical protein